MKKIILGSILGLFFACKEPQARYPVLVKTNSFLIESAQKNKHLLELEQKQINQIIAKDSLHKYITSKNGYKFFYLSENKEDSILPAMGDQVFYKYSIAHLNGNIIYPFQENALEYWVDKQELFPGMQSAIKLLKRNEKAVFFFPSEIAYGYHGDNKKILPNTPLKVQIHLLDIIPQVKDSLTN